MIVLVLRNVHGLLFKVRSHETSTTATTSTFIDAMNSNQCHNHIDQWLIQGGPKRRAPAGSNFSHFHAVLGNFFAE